MPTCRSCEQSFPTRIRIGGKTRNLQNRKHCLSCVPFKKKRQLDREKLRRRKRSSFHKWYWQRKLENGSCPINDLRKQNRAILLSILGDRCQHCGYSNYNGNLVFHHWDENQKKFELSTRTLRYKLDRIVEEASKCIILCHNCHGEAHVGIITVSKNLLEENISILADLHGKSWSDLRD